MEGFQIHGGEGGIRTHGTLASTPVFKTGAINHSATSPKSLHKLLNFLSFVKLSSFYP